MLRYLRDELEVQKDVFEIDVPIDLTALFGFYKFIAPKKEHLVHEHLLPLQPKVLARGEDIFDNSRALYFASPSIRVF